MNTASAVAQNWRTMELSIISKDGGLPTADNAALQAYVLTANGWIRDG